MLDGLLGRTGFFSKCKSLIKQTRTRIETVRRKRNATQKFLRKDIADLLSNSLDSTAFQRADALIAELILSSCYDFIDHVCEIVLKHLPVLQKLRECPEECREAVASLMFGAARFSDLPELRDLRDLFQERYGSSLEYYVNQKLVHNITTKPPTMEKKIQLLQEIALEFSIRWDSRAFQARMSNAVTEKKQGRSPGFLHAAESKIATPFAGEAVQKTIKDEVLVKKRSEATYQTKEREVDLRHHMGIPRECGLGRKDDVKHCVSKGPEIVANCSKPSSYAKETIQKVEEHDIPFQRRAQKVDTQSNKDAVLVGTSSRGRRLEAVDGQHKLERQRHDNVSEIDLPNTSRLERPDVAEGVHLNSMRKRQEDITDASKSKFRGGIPPPYSKPRRSKHRSNADEENDTLTFNPASNSNKADNLPTKADFLDHQDGVNAPEKGEGVGHFTEIYYKDATTAEFTPRRRSHSHRRKHSRSASSQDDKVDGEERVVRRVSTSRRKHESRKGLQILVDDDDGRAQRDEEERMIDKLLLKYSKKPSSADPGKSRRKTNSEMNDVSVSPHHKDLGGNDMDEDSTPATSRSFSLPSRQVAEAKPEKVFTRAASFQQETPAKHVHPKLPDYDDLAARFAALRAAKG